MTQINLTKQNTYVLLTETEKISVTKLNTYALTQDQFGVLFQSTDADRPIYRAAPTSGIPYVDMEATGASLDVTVLTGGVYTFVVFKEDQTFDVFESTLVAGTNTLPVTTNFNQVAAFLGARMHRYTIEAIKAGMRARI